MSETKYRITRIGTCETCDGTGSVTLTQYGCKDCDGKGRNCTFCDADEWLLDRLKALRWDDEQVNDLYVLKMGMKNPRFEETNDK